MPASMRLSAVEQSARTRTLYTQLCFFYDVPHERTQEDILGRLYQGLRRLTEAVPWLAGQVLQQNGYMSIIPYSDLPRLTAKDLTSEPSAPTMQQLRDAGLPFHMLDEKLICPRNTLSDGPNEGETLPYPVLLLQASFVQGGLILSVLACHSAMDIVGQVLIVRLLSKTCHGEPLSSGEIAGCNMDRQNLIPLLEDTESEASNSRQTPKSTPPSSTGQPTTSTVPRLRWAYYQFSESALRALKTSISSTLPNSTPFVSTDDCICALLWRSLARARLTRLNESTNLKFLRQVDVRKYLEIPATYPGNVVTSVVESLTLGELASVSLGTITSALRAQLKPEDLVHSIRRDATAAKAQTRQRYNQGGNTKKKDRENTITMSSWTKAECKDVDFNLDLGSPVAIRRPMFTPIEGLVYLLPKGRAGEILAALCLREVDMDGLKHDKEFRRWTEYIG